MGAHDLPQDWKTPKPAIPYGSDLCRQIGAHLHTAGRHIERGNHDKAAEHLTAAEHYAEAAGSPTWGRYDLTQVIRREQQRKLREREKAIKDREVLA